MATQNPHQYKEVVIHFIFVVYRSIQHVPAVGAEPQNTKIHHGPGNEDLEKEISATGLQYSTIGSCKEDDTLLSPPYLLPTMKRINTPRSSSFFNLSPEPGQERHTRSMKLLLL